MQLNIIDPNALRLINRLQKEMGELTVANCFYDEITNDLQAQILQLNNDLIIWKDKAAAYMRDNDVLKEQIDPSRNGRFASRETKKARKAAAEVNVMDNQSGE